MCRAEVRSVPCNRSLRRCLGVLLVVVCFASFAAPARASAAVRDYLDRAAACENQGDWDRACDLYEAALRLQRNLAPARERYQLCLRRLSQTRRHHDAGYRKEVLSIDYGQ